MQPMIGMMSQILLTDRKETVSILVASCLFISFLVGYPFREGIYALVIAASMNAGWEMTA